MGDFVFLFCGINVCAAIISIGSGLVVLLILLLICCRVYRKREIEKRKELVRKQAEEQIYAREYGGNRRMTNALTAGVHTGKDIDEKDWQAIDKAKEEQKMKDKNNKKTKIKKQSSSMHVQMNTMTISADVEASKSHSQNASINNRSPQHQQQHSHSPQASIPYSPNDMFAQIPMSSFQIAAKHEREQSASNSRTPTPHSASPRLRLQSGSIKAGIVSDGEKDRDKDKDGSGGGGKLTPLHMSRNHSGTLSSEMLFGTQEQFDSARKASFHKQSFASGRLSPKRGAQKLSLQKVGSSSATQQDQLDLDEYAPRMFSNSVAQMTEKNIKFKSHDKHKDKDGDDDEDDDDDGMLNFVSNYNARQASITDMVPETASEENILSPEIAYQQQKKLQEKEQRKMIAHNHLKSVLENNMFGTSVGIKDNDNDDDDEFLDEDIGVTAYGNSRGIVNDDKRQSFGI